MTVYIELLIFDNFALDYLIGYVTLLFLKAEIKIGRLLLSAAAGTLFAIFLPYIPNFLAIFYKLCALVVSVALLRRYTRGKSFFAALVAYALISALLAGIIVLLFNMKASSIVNTFVYDKGGAIGLIAIGALILLYGSRQLIGLMAMRRGLSATASVVLIHGGIEVKTHGLVDTGNRLKDDKGNGVIILGAYLSKKFQSCPHKGKISITTINGEGQFDTVTIDKLKIYYKDKLNTINCVCAALTERIFQGYEVILFAEEQEEI